jgi:hypothetical protein
MEFVMLYNFVALHTLNFFYKQDGCIPIIIPVISIILLVVIVIVHFNSGIVLKDFFFSERRI